MLKNNGAVTLPTASPPEAGTHSDNKHITHFLLWQCPLIVEQTKVRDIKGFKRNSKKSYTMTEISPSKVPVILGGSRSSIVLQKAALILTVLLCVVLFF